MPTEKERYQALFETFKTYVIKHDTEPYPSWPKDRAVFLARMEELDKAIYAIDRQPKQTTRAECLREAERCVCGKREQDYGTPESNFTMIANLWNAYLSCDGFTAQDVAVMMALLKIARIATGTGTADSFIDLAGYAACGCEIATKGE